MSILNTNYINNTTRTAFGNSEKNLQLGSDGSVTSFEGLSISDAAASSGKNYVQEWDGVNINTVYPFDRSKYNKFTVSGWIDMSGEDASNNEGTGLYIQPVINTTSYTISQMNGGALQTFVQSVQDNATTTLNADQMIFNTGIGAVANPFRWVFELELQLSDTIIWSVPRVSYFINYNVSPSSIQQVSRLLKPQDWNTTLGNQFNGFRLITNSLTNLPLAQGRLAVNLSRNTGYALKT